MAVCTIASPPSDVATELVSATASPPAALISSTTVWAGPVELPEPSTAPPRSFTTTRAPRDASDRACSRPRPPPAPVMIATLPSNARSAMGRRYRRPPSPRQLAQGAFLEALVVELAVGGAADGGDLDDPLGRLEAGEVVLDVGDQRGFVDVGCGVRLDEGHDGFAEAVVGNADHCGIGHRRVALEDLLDLFGVDLLAAGVDALAAA